LIIREVKKMGIKRTIKHSAGYDLVLFNDAFDEFYAEKQAYNKSASTLHNYKYTYTAFCEFNGFNEETSTDEVKLQHIYKWIGTLKQKGTKHTSINHYLRDLRAFLYWCMEDDRAYISPAFKIKLVEGQEEAMKLFSEEELEALLEKPRRNDSFADWRTWAIVNWVLATGNRAATICEVKLSDINYSRREIVLAHTKNKKAQIVPLSSSLETVIKEYVRVWRREADIDGWLFPNVGEEQLTTNALRHAFTRYCTKRGVEKSNIHGLRHNFAKGWVQNNGNMFALQKILGHSTLDMTRRYVKLFSEDIKEDFDKFSPLDTIKRSAKRKQTVKRSDY
jgi:integrase/recombinase XerD